MGSTHCLSNFTSPDSSKQTITTFLRNNGAAIFRDWVRCWMLAGIAAGIHSIPIYKPDNRIIPVYLGPSGQLTFPTEFLYPKKDALVSTSLCTFLTGVMPSLVITLFQIKIRSTLDWRVGTTGVMKAVLFTTIISVCLKHFVGGFRPHYIDVCQPDLTLLTNLNVSTNTTWWMSPVACTGNRKAVYEALRGLPSGHAASSFAAAVFLSLYLNAKLKLFSDFAPRTLGLAGLVTPLLLASLMSGSQYVTHQHHAHEILVGILIGVVAGICSYRLRYAAIFDFRYNHIPLTQISSAIDGAPKVGHFRLSYDEKRRLGQ
ncbi:PAP2-domain-containing protein [Acephala macrosclerotiorum]|nr:PAP2-domain-containing protein [Acephala macrosclerotiorum]